MQLYKVFYYPKKGVTNKMVAVLNLPLPDMYRSQALRALYPNHRIGEIRPIGKPLKDTGQYSYWQLSFNYSEGPWVGNPGDDEHSRAASRALSEAENVVEYALLKLGIEHRHTYSWPDGSIFYAIRTQEKDISRLVHLINQEMKGLRANPVTIKWSFTHDKKRVNKTATYGNRSVQVKDSYPIKSPWESDPHKYGVLNWVEYFEKTRSWSKKDKSAEDHNNPVHRAFRAGFEEAFGHQRLYHYSVKPSPFAPKDARVASEEECTAYVAAYGLGKMLLTLSLPDGVAQKPWRLLLDESEVHHP